MIQVDAQLGHGVAPQMVWGGWYWVAGVGSIGGVAGVGPKLPLSRAATELLGALAVGWPRC